MTPKEAYIKRWIAGRLREAIEFSPVTVLTGARQTGKSTLLRNEKPFSNWHYVSFDDLDALMLADTRPEEILGISSNLVIDEVQRSPAFLHHIKRFRQGQVEKIGPVRFRQSAPVEKGFGKPCRQGRVFQSYAFLP